MWIRRGIYASIHVLRLFGMPVGIRETAQRCKRFGVTRVTSLSQGPELPSEGNPFIHKFYAPPSCLGRGVFVSNGDDMG